MKGEVGRSNVCRHDCCEFDNKVIREREEEDATELITIQMWFPQFLKLLEGVDGSLKLSEISKWARQLLAQMQ